MKPTHFLLVAPSTRRNVELSGTILNFKLKLKTYCFICFIAYENWNIKTVEKNRIFEFYHYHKILTYLPIGKAAYERFVRYFDQQTAPRVLCPLYQSAPVFNLLFIYLFPTQHIPQSNFFSLFLVLIQFTLLLAPCI